MQFSFRFQISTLATKLGVRNIAFLGSGLLLANYLGAILVAIYMPEVNTLSKILFASLGSFLNSVLHYF